MSKDITRQSVLFPGLFKKPTVVQFDQPHASCDGGAILLKACDERLGLSERLADCIVDTRQTGPVAGFLRFNDEPDQYLFCYVLRAGNAPAKQGAIGILERVIERVRSAFPKARILIRLDGGFSGPELLNFLEDEAKVDYIIGMAENQVLKRRARRLMRRVRRLSKRQGKTANVFEKTRYAAKSRKERKRRVIIKAEVTQHEGRKPKDNARFAVTNLKGSPRQLHHGMEIDRTSCTSFLANQLRVLLTATAYVLFQDCA